MKQRQRRAERPARDDSDAQPEQQRLIDQVREANDHLVIANLRSQTLSEEAAHAYQRVSVQYAATRILAEAPSLTDVYPRILQAVAEDAGWDFGALWEMDQATHELRCKEVWYPVSGNLLEFTAMSRQATFAPGIGLPGRVWSSGEPVWIADVTRDSNFPRSLIATKEGLHAGFAFPIQLGGVVLGVIEFFSHAIRPPDHELMRTLNAIGSQLGQFIQRKVAEEALAEEVARKSAMLDCALDGVVTMNHDGHIVDFNPAAERIFGYTAEQVTGKSVAETLIPQSLREQHRQGLARFQQTGEGPVLGRRLELTAMRADGTEFPVELAISTARVAGRPAFFTAYLRDLTEQKRAEEALRKWEQTARFLADASANIAELTDPRITLQKIASLAVPFFADWCAVDTLTDDGSLERVAVMHDDPAKVQLAHEIYRRYPPRPDDPHGIMKVLRTGHSELVQEIPDSVLTAGAHDGEHLRITQGLGLRSYICVPLCLRGKTSGVLTFVTAESGRTYNDDALRTAEDLARRTSVAIENAYLYQMSQDAVRARDEFLSMASHELRNPINALQLRLVGVLREAERESESLPRQWVTQRVGQARDQVARLERLVGHLLDVTRIRAGRLDLELEDLEFSSVVQAAVDRVQGELKDRDVILRLRSITGRSDRLRLDQIVTNLLSNAVKYGEGKPIEVSLDAEGDAVRLSVRDHGIGIDAENQKRVFEPFERAVARRQYGGFGLGLWITRQIVDAMRGHISVDSRPGQGSTFSVVVPRTLSLTQSSKAAEASVT